MNSKVEITKAIYENLPAINPFKDSNTEQLIFRWWTTGRSSEGLRLSEEGKLAFTLAEIEYFDFPLFDQKIKKGDIVMSTFTINLGRKIKCPFYIGLKTNQAKSAYIRIYDSKVAMMIELYGSLKEYLDRK